jgi:hypothetical protein
MKALCENNISKCYTDRDEFVLQNKKTKKEFRQKIKDNPKYALSLISKWGFKLSDDVNEKDLIQRI